MERSLRRWVGPLAVLVGVFGSVACGANVQTGADDDGDDGTEPCLQDRAQCDCADGRCGPDPDPDPQPECPASAPTPGAACDGDLTCGFPDFMPCGEGEVTITYRCEDGAWSQPTAPRCSPLECPYEEPSAGDPCDLIGAVCQYENMSDCGPAMWSYTCGEDGTFGEPTVPRCSMLYCRDVIDAATCGDVGCVWKEPGCGDDPIALPEAGCYDPEPCDGSCTFSDELCISVTVLPDCEDCDACGVVEQLCVPHLLGE